ncbi:carbonic anhydrase [Lojkania enalia]|uniref:Carbonic anhydrase n=1 Tax=Lojkania enalia TaxID=147567 RepID=A0A9P4KCK7_9PLEO|nr:carbonic anhydrase [Didymosphaeria enalia]
MLFKSLFLAGTASATCLHGLSKFKREATEGEVEVGKFGYTGLIGPLNWASLAPENEACKTGSNQSPINVDDTINLATEAPVVDIPTEQAIEFENLGTTIEVIVNGTTSFAGSDFRLRQFHMHTPSEHRINGEYYPLELHFVHEGVADSAQIAVISVLFQLDEAADPVLTGLENFIDPIAEVGTKTEVTSGLDFASLINHVQTTPLFQYTGSLTTPPCSEGVVFLIAQNPLPINVAIYNKIKSVVKFNSRVTQNTLGQQNIIEVGSLSGPESPIEFDLEAELAKAHGKAEQVVVEGEPAPVTKGQTITITELHGQPTHIVGVVLKS